MGIDVSITFSGGGLQGAERYLWPTPGMLAASLFRGSPLVGSSPAPPPGSAPYFYSGFLLVLVWARTSGGTRRGHKTAGSRCRSLWSPATRLPPNASPCGWSWWCLKRRRRGGVTVKGILWFALMSNMVRRDYFVLRRGKGLSKDEYSGHQEKKVEILRKKSRYNVDNKSNLLRP